VLDDLVVASAGPASKDKDLTPGVDMIEIHRIQQAVERHGNGS
jgi:hypothetical protein